MPIFSFVSDLIDNPDPVIIMPFGGYANEHNLIICARVLEDEGIQHDEDDPKIKNLWNSYKRFESDEVGGATVRVSWEGNSEILTTNEEGYISLNKAHGINFNDDQQDSIIVTYELIEKGEIIYQTTSEVIKPPSDSDFGIISDVDDTIIETGVASTLKWRVLVNVLLKHSDKRLPLDGAEELYQKLHKGKSGLKANPIFYLSNSPWNIFDYLTAFLQKFEFPKGPLLLRDIDKKFLKKSDFESGHKYQSIVHILQMYPELDFILIGDAGEIDTDIYISIARKNPNRIKSIYIRAVNKNSKIKKVNERIKANSDLDITLIDEKEDAISHAKMKGYL